MDSRLRRRSWPIIGLPLTVGLQSINQSINQNLLTITRAASSTELESEARAALDSGRHTPQIRNIAIEKACSRGITFKDTQDHYNCRY